MNKATITDLIVVCPSGSRPEYLTVSVPNGWEDVSGLANKVLEFEGRRYGFSGWNSDKNEAYFKSTVSVARILPV
ncbi:MAG: hypothetical protein EBR82_32105 [Caulobacteraceae bacterium]|nr:hypothetical protein [Caulobacteraceae bacterium]